MKFLVAILAALVIAAEAAPNTELQDLFAEDQQGVSKLSNIKALLQDFFSTNQKLSDKKDALLQDLLAELQQSGSKEELSTLQKIIEEQVQAVTQGGFEQSDDKVDIQDEDENLKADKEGDSALEQDDCEIVAEGGQAKVQYHWYVRRIHCLTHRIHHFKHYYIFYRNKYYHYRKYYYMYKRYYYLYRKRYFQCLHYFRRTMG